MKYIILITSLFTAVILLSLVGLIIGVEMTNRVQSLEQAQREVWSSIEVLRMRERDGELEQKLYQMELEQERIRALVGEIDQSDERFNPAGRIKRRN